MNAYEALRAKVAEALPDADAATIGRVMGIFYEISEEIDDLDITQFGDTNGRRHWSRLVVAKVPIDGGTYQGPPRRDPFAYRGDGRAVM